MNEQVIAYLVFGICLVALFGVIIRFYYSKKRKTKGEDAKYRMMDDDDS